MSTVFDRVDDEGQGDASGTPPTPGVYKARCCPSVVSLLPQPPGSRRRRLWDLDHHAHCPIIGLCLPVSSLRRLMQRHAQNVPADDYELHCQGVGAARHRIPLAEALQRELDQRHRLALQAVSRLEKASRSHTLERERLQAQALQLRGVVFAREARIAQLNDEVQALRQARPDLPARLSLSRQLSEQVERLRDLQRTIDRLTGENDSLRAAASTAANDPAVVAAPSAIPASEAGARSSALIESLRDRAVLCVGGRTGSVPVYRQLIEAAGAQFLHHDGGDENNAQRLEHTLAAADLVVCQTGCISHGAYWRVKDHCRRTGKRCVFVEQPSASSLQRALGIAANCALDEERR